MVMVALGAAVCTLFALTTMAAPAPAWPALAWVTMTLARTALAVKSVGVETWALIADAINTAAPPTVVPDGTENEPAITEVVPIVMLLIVPPALATLVTVIWPSFATAGKVPISVFTRPRCLG